MEKIATPTEDEVILSAYLPEEGDKDYDRYYKTTDFYPWHMGILSLDDLMEIDPGVREIFL